MDCNYEYDFRTSFRSNKSNLRMHLSRKLAECGLLSRGSSQVVIITRVANLVSLQKESDSNYKGE